MTEQKQIKRRLNWQSGHDPRSFHYRYGAALEERKNVLPPRPRMWRPGVILDQGREGACVGYGWTAELLASPHPYEEGIFGEATAFAKRLYQRARAYDRQMGWNWPEGASVISGAKAVRQLGYIGEFRWAMNMDELCAAVVNEGPVVIGIPWHEGMYQTRPSGLVKVEGREVGGHCLTLIGYHPGMRITGEDWHKRYEVYRWVNSWGTAYGNNGTGLILAEDLARLLDKRGEACVPMRRNQIRHMRG